MIILDLKIQFRDKNGIKYEWCQGPEFKISVNKESRLIEIPLKEGEIEKTIDEIRERLYYMLPTWFKEEYNEDLDNG